MLFPVIVKKLKTMEVSILIIRQERPEDYDTVYHVVKGRIIVITGSPGTGKTTTA